MDPMNNMDKAKAYSYMNRTHGGGGGSGKGGAKIGAIIATILVGLATYGAAQKHDTSNDAALVIGGGWVLVSYLWYRASK
jgi:hypothetical protein